MTILRLALFLSLPISAAACRSEGLDLDEAKIPSDGSQYFAIGRPNALNPARPSIDLLRRTPSGECFRTHLDRDPNGPADPVVPSGWRLYAIERYGSDWVCDERFDWGIPQAYEPMADWRGAIELSAAAGEQLPCALDVHAEANFDGAPLRFDADALEVTHACP